MDGLDRNATSGSASAVAVPPGIHAGERSPPPHPGALSNTRRKPGYACQPVPSRHCGLAGPSASVAPPRRLPTASTRRARGSRPPSPSSVSLFVSCPSRHSLVGSPVRLARPVSLTQGRLDSKTRGVAGAGAVGRSDGGGRGHARVGLTPCGDADVPGIRGTEPGGHGPDAARGGPDPVGPRQRRRRPFRSALTRPPPCGWFTKTDGQGYGPTGAKGARSTSRPATRSTTPRTTKPRTSTGCVTPIRCTTPGGRSRRGRRAGAGPGSTPARRPATRATSRRSSSAPSSRPATRR